MRRGLNAMAEDKANRSSLDVDVPNGSLGILDILKREVSRESQTRREECFLLNYVTRTS